MSDSESRFSHDLLADLHADVLPPEQAAKLWPEVMADADARSYIESLDEVRNVLGSLGSAGLSAHGEKMPEDVAARLDALWDSDALWASPPAEDIAPVVELRPRSAVRRVRRAWLVAAVAAILAGVGAVGIWAGTQHRADPDVQAEPPGVVRVGKDMAPNTLLLAMGHHSAAGRLSSDEAIRECLTAVGIPEGRTLLGSAAADFNGHSSVLVLVAGPTKGAIKALIVNSDCQESNAHIYAQRDI